MYSRFDSHPLTPTMIGPGIVVTKLTSNHHAVALRPAHRHQTLPVPTNHNYSNKLIDL